MDCLTRKRVCLPDAALYQKDNSTVIPKPKWRSMVSLLDGESNYVLKEELNEVTCKFIQARNKGWGRKELRERMTRLLLINVSVPPLPQVKTKVLKHIEEDEALVKRRGEEKSEIPVDSKNQENDQVGESADLDDDHDSIGWGEPQLSTSCHWSWSAMEGGVLERGVGKHLFFW